MSIYRRYTPNVLNKEAKASRYFDLLRGISAVYVMVFHFRAQLYVGHDHILHTTPIVTLLYFGTSLGDDFVMAFFVLSGFLISGSVLNAILQGRWSWRGYAFNRLARLWIVLVPAMFLTYVWDKVAMIQFDAFTFFEGTMSWHTLLGNLLFLQGIAVPNFGANGPLWSLSYEFWYYVLFPCMVLVFYEKRRPLKAMYGSIVVILLLILGRALITYFIVWLLGALLAIIPFKPRLLRRTYSLIGAVLLVMAALSISELLVYKGVLGNSLLNRFPAEFVVGLSFMILLYVCYARYNQALVRNQGFSFSNFLAGFSYTLYLAHWPVLMYLRMAFGHNTWQPDVKHLVMGVLLCLGIIVYAWLLSIVSEKKTKVIKQYLKRLSATAVSLVST